VGYIISIQIYSPFVNRIPKKIGFGRKASDEKAQDSSERKVLRRFLFVTSDPEGFP
jgi:hypothetical protein